MILLYIERWLVAPLQMEDGTIVARTKDVPQGSVIGSLLANLYLHYVMDVWLSRKYPKCTFERYADNSVIHYQNKLKADKVLKELEARLQECGLEMHRGKTQIVYCKDSNRNEKQSYKEFDFLGFTFRPRQAQNSNSKEIFTNWLPSLRNNYMRSMTGKMKGWTIMRVAGCQIEEIAKAINLVLEGWINYYPKFYSAKLRSFMNNINVIIAR